MTAGLTLLVGTVRIGYTAFVAVVVVISISVIAGLTRLVCTVLVGRAAHIALAVVVGISVSARIGGGLLRVSYLRVERLVRVAVNYLSLALEGVLGIFVLVFAVERLRVALRRKFKCKELLAAFAFCVDLFRGVVKLALALVANFEVIEPSLRVKIAESLFKVAHADLGFGLCILITLVQSA